MLSRKHFKELANILLKYKASDELILEIARWLLTQNPRFDISQFIDAVKPPNGSVRKQL